MQLEVQLEKKLSIEKLKSQIERVKGEKISYSLVDKNAFYALNVHYDTLSSYTEFMERLHNLWRN